MSILIGLIMFAVGMLVVVFNRQVYNFTGGIDFVEKHSPGNTQNFLKLFGILLVFLGILFFTGLGGVITNPIFEGIKNTFHLGG